MPDAEHAEEQVGPAPAYPTLDVTLVGADGKSTPFKPNSRTPIPVETPNFSGRVLLIVRPEMAKEDPYYHRRIFEGKTRRFEMQVQGRFKSFSGGVLYMGGELRELRQMQLGVLTKGIARGLLGLLHKKYPLLHYSFGDSAGVEAPRIVFPLWSAADWLIITKEGEVPPELGSRLDSEPEASRKARRNGGAGKIDPRLTYTFSYCSSNVNLPTWTLRNIPIWNNIDLHGFWLDAPLRIVIYEHEPRKGHDPHRPKPEGYALCLSLRHVPDGQRRHASAERAEAEEAEAEATEEEAYATAEEGEEEEEGEEGEAARAAGGVARPAAAGGGLGGVAAGGAAGRRSRRESDDADGELEGASGSGEVESASEASEDTEEMDDAHSFSFGSVGWERTDAEPEDHSEDTQACDYPQARRAGLRQPHLGQPSVHCG